MKRLVLCLLPALLVFSACDTQEDTVVEEITFEDLVIGTGKTADPYEGPTVTYVGTLTDGTQFGGETFAFALDNGEVIQGFNDGVLGMKEGGRRRVTVPPSLGYGSRGREDIPPNSTLIFDITLDSVAEVAIVELEAGAGEIADANDTATVTYKGTLTSGTTFDQGTFSFVVDGGRVIAGFNAGVRGMKPGGKRRITVPPVLAYGDQANGGIPANSTLIFDITLNALAKR